MEWVLGPKTAINVQKPRKLFAPRGPIGSHGAPTGLPWLSMRSHWLPWGPMGMAHGLTWALMGPKCGFFCTSGSPLGPLGAVGSL